PPVLGSRAGRHQPDLPRRGPGARGRAGPGPPHGDRAETLGFRWRGCGRAGVVRHSLTRGFPTARAGLPFNLQHMRLGPLKLTQVRLAVVLLHDRLAVAALAGERVEAFTIATENPAVVLREELAARQLTPRAVALALSRSAVFVRPMELPVVGGDMREMVRLNLDGHLPSAGDETAFDYVPLPAEADGVRREDTLQRVLVVAAEPRAVEAALRIAEESRLRPVSLTVASHDLLALARPDRGQRVVWVHRAGANAD